MEKFLKLTGCGAPLLENDIDTDMIIPAQCLRSPSFDLGEGLFYHRRFNSDGSTKHGFVLNQSPFDTANILVSGSNFGCGSSREHAVWALYRFGIRCVIATSFGEIFYENCFKNGLLPALVSDEDLNALKHELPKADYWLTIDLPERRITANGNTFAFAVPSDKQARLIEGLDEINVTFQDIGTIRSFRAADSTQRPWIYEVEETETSS